MVATGCTDSDPNGSNMVPDTGFPKRRIGSPWGNWGRMENGPGSVAPHAGTYRAPSLPESESEGALILPDWEHLTDSERRDQWMGLLDDARRHFELARHKRVQLMVAAKEAGVRCMDIAVALGITENAVYAQVKKVQLSHSAGE